MKIAGIFAAVKEVLATIAMAVMTMKDTAVETMIILIRAIMVTVHNLQ